MSSDQRIPLEQLVAGLRAAAQAMRAEGRFQRGGLDADSLEARAHLMEQAAQRLEEMGRPAPQVSDREGA